MSVILTVTFNPCIDVSVSVPVLKPEIKWVGAGDSMIAGILWSLHMGKNLKNAATYGCLCGAAAILHPGTSLCNLHDIELLKKIPV
jgi:6-phosphofructokinase 2